jgi:hypothetical protein
MVTDPTGIDPYDCPDCVAVLAICPYHQGWADGWDCASAMVGQYVTAGAEADV